MENNLKNIKKKKRKLKPVAKLVLFLFLIIIIFISLYKINSTSSFIKTTFSKTTSSIKKIFSKDKEIKVSLEESDNVLISIFKKRLPSQNMELASTSIMQNGDIKIFLKNTKNESGYLYVNTKDNSEEVWNTFASLLIADPLKGLLSKDLYNLNYIDLRFKNKVFYKFNNNSNISNTIFTSTTSTSSIKNTNN